MSPCLAQGHLLGTSEPSWNKALTHVFEVAEDRESPPPVPAWLVACLSSRLGREGSSDELF